MIKTNQNLIGEKVIIRSNLSGVHIGTLLESILMSDGSEFVTLADARRLWKWQGAEDCSDLATLGIDKNNISGCNISVPVEQVSCVSCETIKCTEKSYKSINSIPYWTGTGTSQEDIQVIRNSFKDAETLIQETLSQETIEI